jgi:hypothetical protein
MDQLHGTCKTFIESKKMEKHKILIRFKGLAEAEISKDEINNKKNKEIDKSDEVPEIKIIHI